jgi:hypothetical protein
MIEVLKQIQQCLKDKMYAHAEMYLSEAIAELESQEPVATVTSETGADITMSWWHEPPLPIGTRLFTYAPQRTWAGLTEERIKEIWLKGKDHGDDWQDVLALARSFEAELKGLNT